MFLARTPLHSLLRWGHRKLDRYIDLAENWNNGDETLNGEAFLIRSVAAHLSVVLDIGANVGNWSAALIEQNPKCRVFAFEPSPATHATLKKRAEGRAQWRVFQAGMGDQEGVLSFCDYGDNSVLSSFVSREASIGLQPQRRLEAPVTTVDAFLAREKLDLVDFVKIDTEGYEMKVLRGMKQALKSHRIGLIQFEYGGTWLDAGETLSKANDWFKDHHYQLFRLYPDHVSPVEYDCRKHECFKYSNFLAARSSSILSDWGVPVR